MIIELIQGGGKLMLEYDADPMVLWSVEASYFLPETGPAPDRVSLIFESGASYEVTTTTQSFSGGGQYVVLIWEIGQANSFLVHYSIPVLNTDTWHLSVAQQETFVDILAGGDDTTPHKLYATVDFANVLAVVQVEQSGAETVPLEAGQNNVVLTAPARIVVDNLTVTGDQGMLTIEYEVVPTS